MILARSAMSSSNMATMIMAGDMETLYSVKETNLIHKTQYDMDQQMFLAEFETCKEEVLAKLKASGEALKEAAAIAKQHKLKISMLKHQDILPVLSAIDAAGWSSSTLSAGCYARSNHSGHFLE